ncbi:DoxX family protein [Rhodohalobacter sp. 8-1]|uniref:DoxX family protein n=1 Tax=Rhodohalobacter sp. 8-1 TaxID=3131972 RepID=UPI0030EE0A07
MFKKLLSPRLDEWVSPDVAVCLLRIGASALIMTHGFPKFLKILEGDFSFGDPLGIGEAPSLFLVAFAEFICAILVLLGLWTRIALIPLIITMIVAVFIAHAGDPFGRKELGLFFLISFVVLFLTGPGKYSLDKRLWGK